MIKRVSLYLLLLLIFPASGCRPCENTAVRGYAQMETLGQYYNAPGAAITFVSKENRELRYETSTNSHGNYEILLPSGQYRVHVSWSGYPPLFKEYSLGKLNPKWSFDVKIEGCSQNLAVGKVLGKEATNITIDND